MMCEVFMALVAGSWVETRPLDFMDGQWDPGIYVSRRLAVESANPMDSGAVEIYARFDGNKDGYYDLISASAYGPGVILWFGGPNGYSSANYRSFPVSAGGNCDMADLNIDDWPELIHSGWEMLECRIYWGSAAAGGPDPNNYTSLPQSRSEAVYIHDLDKDTYLDIILGEQNANIRVYWGGSGGYSPGNYSLRSDLGPLNHNIEVADLNKDSYPDIILKRENSLGNSWGISIVWGDGDRNLNNNPVWFHEAGPFFCSHGLTIGDFNRDGWLDIVVSQTDYRPGTSRVYFSDNGLFDAANMITLSTNECYGGSAAWDFNGDGWLDLLFYRGRADYSMLFYPNTGSPPYFRDQDTVEVGQVVGYTGGFIYDFNWDGKADVFANGWARETSFVYWGVQATGVYDSVQKLPVPWDHHGGFRECGNAYDRSPYAWYESGVFSESNLQAEATISWIAWDSLQIASVVRMYIRTRQDGSSPWSAWREVSNGETVNESPYFPARDIQYRAELCWENPAWLPWLEKVNLTTSPLSAEESASGEDGLFRFGSGKGMVWVSWPGMNVRISLYSADGRMIDRKALMDGRAEFQGLRPGVYYLVVGKKKEKAIVR